MAHFGLCGARTDPHLQSPRTTAYTILARSRLCHFLKASQCHETSTGWPQFLGDSPSWILCVSACRFLGPIICLFLTVEAARPCWEIDSLPLSQRVPFKQETSLCYMFPVSAHRHGVNFHFLSSFWNSQTLLTKLRQENCRIPTHSHPQFFPLLFFSSFPWLIFSN